jgi:hypothetical protein
MFPVIQSPCPYKGDLADIVDGGVCRLCKREVYDLTDMAEPERVAFLQGCEDAICVSYTVTARTALAALALGAAAVATPVAAADRSDNIAPSLPRYALAGGITVPRQAQWVKHESIAKPSASSAEADNTPQSSNQRKPSGKRTSN